MGEKHCIYCGHEAPSKEHLERHMYEHHKREMKKQESNRIFKLRNR